MRCGSKIGNKLPMTLRLLIAPALLLAAACGGEEPPAEEAAPAPEEEKRSVAPQFTDEKVVEELPAIADELSCAAENYEALVGKQLAAVTLPSNLTHRVIEGDAPVTMDYDPDRMNIHVDANGVITEVECG